MTERTSDESLKHGLDLSGLTAWGLAKRLNIPFYSVKHSLKPGKKPHASRFDALMDALGFDLIVCKRSGTSEEWVMRDNAPGALGFTESLRRAKEESMLTYEQMAVLAGKKSGEQSWRSATIANPSLPAVLTYLAVMGYDVDVASRTDPHERWRLVL